MESTRSPGKTASAIWSRIVKPEQANLAPEAARAILKLDFDPDDVRRANELSARAEKGTLTPEEGAELDEYIRVGHELAVLQLKARSSLERANQSSRTKGKPSSARDTSVKASAPAKKAAANGPAASVNARPASQASKRRPTGITRAPKPLKAGKVSHGQGDVAPCTRSHTPNARTRKALRDADAGKNLTSYADADDLFRKLGITLGEEKA